MSNTSGTSEQIISLPKSGGAMGSIGEKFSPDLLTGTGNFTVPIALPPGRHGFQPELNLLYSTGHGNGPFGLGWSLSIPGVSRKASKGVPLFDDEKDAFLLEGVQAPQQADELFVFVCLYSSEIIDVAAIDPSWNRYNMCLWDGNGCLPFVEFLMSEDSKNSCSKKIISHRIYERTHDCLEAGCTDRSTLVAYLPCIHGPQTCSSLTIDS